MVFFVYNGKDDGRISDVEEFASLEAAKVELKWRNRTNPPNVFAAMLENQRPSKVPDNTEKAKENIQWLLHMIHLKNVKNGY